MLKVLVVDDDQGLRLSVQSALVSTARFAVNESFDGLDAMQKIKADRYDVVILDVDMPRLGGLDTLKQIKEYDPGIIVLMLTAFATIDDAVVAVKEGAYNYLSKPVVGEQLISLVDKAIAAHAMISNIAASAPTLNEAGKKIIGNTAQMQKVFNIIHRLSKVDTPVMIRGASGTGKELVARAIHYNSARKDHKFVAVNCSAIPENLFESEFFGHEKGSFTGADQRKIGKFQYAENGTLFLDEAGDLPLHMQVKLLRVLQEKVFTPVGSNREIESNVRVVAATNRPLEDMIRQGTFREDLFYRLNVIPIFLPQLADRKDDLDSLVHIFIKKFNAAHGKKISGLTQEAMACLKKYDWPGNIRELENVIEHSFILENSNLLTLGSLPESLLDSTGVNIIEAQENPFVAHKTQSPVNHQANDDMELDEEPLSLDDLGNISADQLDFNAQKESFEKEFIIKALKTFKGRINQTALHANIPKKTLLRKIEKYGIVAKDFSDPA